ncbi:hypothetical protein [Actinobacillus lignieresii]|uniref:Uncharacterized protein n=1 Tax=Actinobacillus lignieresii TaxID=720 RepID=A0A376BDN6_ACTLI|nr:hypothetical protein [Actinobacillus lignieresii]SSX60352.1 Uncharacterised protein [Actinobacillus lignieresii]
MKSKYLVENYPLPAIDTKITAYVEEKGKTLGVQRISISALFIKACYTADYLPKVLLNW